WHFVLLVPLGVFLLGILHRPAFRERCVRVLMMVGRGLRFVLIALPLQVIPITAIRRIANSWGFQLLYWYVIKPAPLTLVIVVPRLDVVVNHFYWFLALFVLVNIVVNSQFGRAASEAMRTAVVQLGLMVRSGLLGGLVNFLLWFFKQAVELVEYLLF